MRTVLPEYGVVVRSYINGLLLQVDGNNVIIIYKRWCLRIRSFEL